MATRRTRHRADVQNLDSLLDTMANVTGILVVLLAVTQISVGDAMKRLRAEMAARPELTREALELTRAEADRISAALAPLLPRRGELTDAHRARRDALALLHAEISESRARIEAAAAADPASFHERTAETRRRARALEDEIAALRTRIGALDAQLADSGARAARHEARLPDPRPPPPGATRIVYFARYGRIFRVRTDELFAALNRGLLDASAGRWSLERPVPLALDRNRVVSHFQRNDLGTRALRWHVLNLGPDQFYGQLEWRDVTHGETLEEIVQRESLYRRDLSLLHPHRTYFQYYVWDDSFEVYLSAREQANEAGFASGWVALDRDQPIRSDFIADAPGALID
ncbi:MAG: hypothetical protein OEW02_04575 [Myxococcales bacterium]|nr:hypothetical protein [Myxococcales bacterium]MDH5565268.1 hypothetical protein [Myxococcales bacterium]